MNCDLCDEPVTVIVGSYFEVTGWEQVREKGGANKIAKRKRTGKIAHKRCMEDLIAGNSPDQGHLFS